jgi:hypothetical protein
MEHTTEQLANALQTLGFQRIAYPSEKYQVFENGKLRYLVGVDGGLRRGASVNSSVALGADDIARLITEADQAMRDQHQRHEEQSDTEHQAEPEQDKRADNQEPATPQQPRSKGGKQQVLVDLLTRAEGATIAQIVTATSWQAHSVRGVISGVLKKKLGLHIISEKTKGGERIYRVAAENKAEPAV